MLPLQTSIEIIRERIGGQFPDDYREVMINHAWVPMAVPNAASGCVAKPASPGDWAYECERCGVAIWARPDDDFLQMRDSVLGPNWTCLCRKCAYKCDPDWMFRHYDCVTVAMGKVLG